MDTHLSPDFRPESESRVTEIVAKLKELVHEHPEQVDIIDRHMSFAPDPEQDRYVDNPELRHDARKRIQEREKPDKPKRMSKGARAALRQRLMEEAQQHKEKVGDSVPFDESPSKIQPGHQTHLVPSISTEGQYHQQNTAAAYEQFAFNLVYRSSIEERQTILQQWVNFFAQTNEETNYPFLVHTVRFLAMSEDELEHTYNQFHGKDRGKSRGQKRLKDSI